MVNKHLMTEHELALAVRNNRFVEEFKSMSAQYKGVSKWRIIQAIAKKENTTGQTVRMVLLKKGTISKRERNKG